MKKYLIVLAALITCACIKPPDDGMALGEETSADSINKVMYDAQTGVPETQAFHVNDNGVIQSLETVFSSVKLKELDVYTITSMDPGYFYFSDFKVRANTTTKYKLARAAAPAPGQSPTPTPTPPAAATPLPPPSQVSLFTNSVRKFVQNITAKVNFVLSKVTIQVSTAVGETKFVRSTPRKMEAADLRIQNKLRAGIHNLDSTTIEDADTSQPLTDGDPNTTERYFGLSSYSHVYLTNNCSQLKDCKVNSTHIEFNQVITTAGTSQKIHWVYEISKEVPGLFTVMSRCGSSVAIVNNGQVPFMECEILDTFQFGI